MKNEQDGKCLQVVKAMGGKQNFLGSTPTPSIHYNSWIVLLERTLVGKTKMAAVLALLSEVILKLTVEG